MHGPHDGRANARHIKIIYLLIRHCEAQPVQPKRESNLSAIFGVFVRGWRKYQA